ncbi:MAG TPA: hypothetical protein VK133_03665 [Amoebophilaceae bacterium]|jgi:hypothetical protein|nr:hypothetical protein [Amoebophilaceae bacterium]
MRIPFYLLGIFVFISTSLSTPHARATLCDQNSTIQAINPMARGVIVHVQQALSLLQHSKAEGEDVDHEPQKPSDSLEEILKKDIDSEGVMSNILGGLALCYNALANILLYPIFSFLLILLSVGALVLAAFWIQKFKKEQPISVAWLTFSGLYVLLYIDLFLVLFQKSTVLFLFLELEKDLIVMILAALIGYTVGKHFSSKKFEEQEMP